MGDAAVIPPSRV